MCCVPVVVAVLLAHPLRPHCRPLLQLSFGRAAGRLAHRLQGRVQRPTGRRRRRPIHKPEAEPRDLGGRLDCREQAELEPPGILRTLKEK